jgi:hypothetical protein
MTTLETHTGGCLCGRVRYQTRGALRGVIACHCSQCRRASGHFAAMTSIPTADLTLTASASLVWYASSASSERGFCGVCGSNLFWRPRAENRTAIAAGTLDVPTHLAIMQHIYVADKSDYYAIDDDLPKKRQGSAGP